MFLPGDLINLILYCVQQLGVMLTVGAETVVLVAYLMAMRDGVVDAQEAQFARAVRRVLSAGLWCIIGSGIGITAVHLLAGNSVVIFAPVYLFKWLLVGIVVAVELAMRRGLPTSIGEGLAGGTWYALFLIHILAPVASWGVLLTLYVFWIAGFALCWGALVFSTGARALREEKKKPVVTAVSQKTPVARPPPSPGSLRLETLSERALWAAPRIIAPPPPLPTPKIPPPPPLPPKPVLPPPVTVIKISPVPVPQPIGNLPVFTATPLPAPAPQKIVATVLSTASSGEPEVFPIAAVDINRGMKHPDGGLSPVHVMPKTKEELQQLQNPVVQST